MPPEAYFVVPALNRAPAYERGDRPGSRPRCSPTCGPTRRSGATGSSRRSHSRRCAGRRTARHGRRASPSSTAGYATDATNPLRGQDPTARAAHRAARPVASRVPGSSTWFATAATSCRHCSRTGTVPLASRARWILALPCPGRAGAPASGWARAATTRSATRSSSRTRRRSWRRCARSWTSGTRPRCSSTRREAGEVVAGTFDARHHLGVARAADPQPAGLAHGDARSPGAALRGARRRCARHVRIRAHPPMAPRVGCGSRC